MLRLLRPENEPLNMNNTEIVFDLDSDGYWGYYIADHNSRHLFWLNDFRVPSLIEGGDESLAHLSEFLNTISSSSLSEQCLEHRINSEYFMHLSFFPYNNTLPENLLDNLQGMVAWSLGGECPLCVSFAIQT